MAHVKEASRRWMYSGRRPNRVAALLNRGTAAMVAAGIGPKRIVRLEVRGRRTGRRLSFPVVIADYEGRRYLVAMSAKRQTGSAMSARPEARQRCGMGAERR